MPVSWRPVGLWDFWMPFWAPVKAPPVRSPSPSSSADSQMEPHRDRGYSRLCCMRSWLRCLSRESGGNVGLVLYSCSYCLRLFTLTGTNGVRLIAGTPIAAWTTTTVGTQMDTRDPGASPPTQIHPGSTATSDFVASLFFLIKYTYYTSSSGCVYVEVR